MYKLKNTG